MVGGVTPAIMPVEMYCKTVFGSPKFFALFLLGLAFTSTAVLSAKPQSQASQQTAAAVSNPAGIVKLRIDSEIEPILADYISNGIDRAAQEHAALVLITIDTPGGLDSAMRQIIAKILASPVPVVTFVSPTGSRAASAGFFILLSADVAAMSPGTDTGAASPVMILAGSSVQIDETMRHKIVNEAEAYLRSYVSQRGRNVDLALTAVSDAKAFSEKEALDGKLIDLVEPSQEALLAALNGRTITRFDGSKTKLDLGSPNVTRSRDDGAREISFAHRAARCVFHFVDCRRARALRGIHASGFIRARRHRRHCSVARAIRDASSAREFHWSF